MTEQSGQSNRKFVVGVYGYCDVDVEAATKSKARWQTYKMAREAGYFSSGFGAFLAAGVTVTERFDRRATDASTRMTVSTSSESIVHKSQSRTDTGG